MRVLVTGATGFIGRRLVERLLAAGDEVVALVRHGNGPWPAGTERLTVAHGEVNDPAAVARAVAECEAVVHLANATQVVDPAVVQAVNVGGTVTVLEAARAAGVRRVIFTSSLSATRARLGPYGRSKLEAEERVRQSELSFVILRPSLVYGDPSVGLVAGLLRWLRTLPVVPVIGDGEVEVDPVHVDDVCAVITRCLTRADVPGKTYCVLGPDRATFNVFLRELAAALGVRKRLLHIPAGAALAMARLLGALTAKPPLTEDNVLGLTSPARIDRAQVFVDPAIAWTPLRAGLHALVRS